MTDRSTPSDQSDDVPSQEAFLTGAESRATDASDEADTRARAFACALARLFTDDKCSDVVVLDVRGRSPLTDYLVIASGTSERQMGSVLEHASDLADEQGQDTYALTKDAGTLWLIADFVDVVAHLFEPNTRAHYDLEMLWGDAKRIEWERTPDE